MAQLAQSTHSNTKDQNYTLLQGYNWHSQGGSVMWKKRLREVEELANMGITALWVPPPTKATSTNSALGFDVYDVWDLGEFDQQGSVPTKWGTKNELKALVKKAKEHGIVTYIDAVLNHKAGAEKTETFKAREVDENDRTKFLSDPYDIDGWTYFDFPGRKGKYSDMKWRFHHFTGVDWDQKGEKKGIFKIQGHGKDWAPDADDTHGSYDYLMYSDVDTQHPEAIKDMQDWGVWIINELDAAGFRFDAARHMSEKFLSDFIQHVRDKTGKDIFGVGEYFTEEIDSLTGYLDTFSAQFSLFDCPLHYNFQKAGTQMRDYDMRKIFDGTLVQARPMDAVCFVDNHDTQSGQTLDSFVNPQFKPLAYALILLRHEGYPCVFSGDLWGIDGDAGDDEKAEPITQLGDIIAARRWFAYGETRDYWDHPNCLGWVRAGDAVHDGLAVLLCTGDEGSKRMEIGKQHAGEEWTDLRGWHQATVTIGEDGWAEFFCPATSVSIWTRKDAKGRANNFPVKYSTTEST